MPQAQTANPVLNLFPLIFIFVIFYFLLIRPQKTKDKEHQKMLTNLNKNDEVVTSSGIHGTIVNVKDKTLILRVDDNVKLEIEKNCVAYIKKNEQQKIN
ncbi:MAG: preprotein translocase subunit YajC [Candidatus Omnitrophica bacterium]|nr:preprotein translocase subunit YajC [Candidatus Omnitrophota bacterium]